MENIKKLLKDKGLKATSQRISILQSFSKNCAPENAESISKKLKKVDLVTIYRTLETFEKSSLIRRVDIRKESIFYELAESDHHHHIVCTSCGTVEEFSNNKVEKFIDQAVQKSSKFTTINEHALELFGLCNSCVKA